VERNFCEVVREARMSHSRESGDCEVRVSEGEEAKVVIRVVFPEDAGPRRRKVGRAVEEWVRKRRKCRRSGVRMIVMTATTAASGVGLRRDIRRELSGGGEAMM